MKRDGSEKSLELASQNKVVKRVEPYFRIIKRRNELAEGQSPMEIRAQLAQLHLEVSGRSMPSLDLDGSSLNKLRALST
jgi:hypothetical protein